MSATIIQGDCMDVMKDIPSGSIDLVVTSPPYNMKNNVGGALASKCKSDIWRNPELRNGYNTYSDDLDYNEYIEWQRKCLKEMLRLIPEDGAIFYNHKFRIQKGLLLDRHEITEGFPLRQIIIWSRKCGVNFNRNYFLPTFEVIFLIAKPKFKLIEKANRQSDVWVMPPEKNNPHPAPFPLNLVERIISSTDAQTVFDPFTGSGTTAVASLKLNRDFIGSELDGEYVKMANERIKSVQPQLI